MKPTLLISSCCSCRQAPSHREFPCICIGVSNRARPRLSSGTRRRHQGGLYYALLSVGDNAAGAYYVPNPLDAPAADEHILVDDGLDYTIPNGRGITGIAVDSQGNVYLAFETGTASSSNVTKLSPSPDFEWVGDFGAGGSVFNNKRYNSVELLTDEILAVGTFNDVEFMDATTGETLHLVTGGSNYMRDLAYNPATHDIYISRNSGQSGLPVSSANILSGGSR